MCILAFKVNEFLNDVDPNFDLTSADGDSSPASTMMDYSWEPITPANLSSSSPGRRRKGERQTERETEISGSCRRMTMMMEERGEEITESSSVRIRPHLSSSLHIQSPLSDVHRQTPERKRSARGHGVPSRGKALLNPSIHTHTLFPSSFHMPSWPHY